MTTKDLKCHNEDLVQPNKYASNKYIFKKKTKQVVFFKKRVKKKKKSRGRSHKPQNNVLYCVI